MTEPQKSVEARLEKIEGSIDRVAEVFQAKLNKIEELESLAEKMAGLIEYIKLTGESEVIRTKAQEALDLFKAWKERK